MNMETIKTNYDGLFIHANFHFSVFYIIQPIPSGSGNQKLCAPITFPQTSRSSKKSQNDDFQSLWDDELNDIGPPTISRSNASSIYGVSDDPNSERSKTSHDRICEGMMLQSSDDEEPTETGMKDLLGELHVGDMVPVLISDVNNPLKFWLHIRQAKYEQQFNQLYNDMQ